jgi:beta-mannosidase
MKKYKIIVLLILMAVPVIINSCKTPVEYELNNFLLLDSNWSFQMKGEDEWLPAEVPGCVHTDLLKNDKIAQPFYRNNEKELQWIDKKDWIYRCSFTLDSLQMSYNRILLNLDGLDTYAKVILNGEVVLVTDNMFRNFQVDVTHFLKRGTNLLEIEFTSPITEGLKKLDALGYGLPAVNDLSEIGGLGNKKVSVFTRKAPYQYGWDWGPRFVTMGIWRPVKLTFMNKARIDNVYYRQSLVNSSEAIIDAIVEVDVVSAGEYTLELYKENEPEAIATATPELENGINSITIPFSILNPDLWWPNGAGQQHRYKFSTRLLEGGKVIDTISDYIGLRSIELIREPDSLGKSFYFRVNGKNIFAKGANYIPNDNFLNLVTAEKYENIIKSAAESNMNMLRVWGGGIYENDIFYNLCDRYGIMLWQEFMFACSMYPGDDAFLENVRQEAIDNVKRLRNHASIMMWCGNNEIDVAWCEGDMNCGWNWKQQYTPDQRKIIWHSYDTLFYKILPEIIETYDQTRAYWPSSPLADWGVHSNYKSTMGDIHYWGVWHGNEPFSSYYKVIGRFMSEYGFQSFPDFQSIRKFTLPHDRHIDSEVLLAHQRSGYGNKRIIDYMEKLYPVPEDFNELLYVSQIMQAEAVKSAILAHRANKPYCMGTLYWQLNDCWPAASWSSIDYYTSWKALQYFVKKAYAPVTISFFPDNDRIRIFINSDLDEDKIVDVHYTIKDFSGNVLSSETVQSSLEYDRSVKVFSLNMNQIKRSFHTSEVFLQVDVLEGKKTLASDIYLFEIPKKLKLPDTNISASVRTENEHLVVELSSEKLAKNVYLWIEDCDSKFSDNYFDLLPGEKKVVTVPLCGQEISQNEVHILSLNKILQ